MILLLPFSSKELPTGEKLSRRKHGYTFTLNASGQTIYSIEVPYAWCKVMDFELVWFPDGVTATCNIRDTDNGMYSGENNKLLGQHGVGVCISKDFYHDKNSYDADIYMYMILEIVFDNSSNITKTVGLNIPFHEVV